MNNRTRSAVAEELGVPESTLRGWENRYKIDVPLSGGKRIYNDDVARVLETVKNLKEQHRTDETIQRAIRSELPQSVSEPPPPAAPREQSPQVDADAIRVAVVAAIQEHNDLADKYAVATHQIGRLEERVKGYELQLESSEKKVSELSAQIKLLPAPDEVAALRREAEEAKLRLALAEQALAEEKLAHESERKKTWWQKLFG